MTSVFRIAVLSVGLLLFACQKPDPVKVRGTLIIDGGAATTRSSTVQLALQVTPSSGAKLQDMCFSNDGDIWTAWEPFASTVVWRLAAGDGVKKVYAKIRDSNKQEGKLNSQILLDTTPPDLTSALLNGGAQYTNSATVSLTVSVAAETGSPLTGLCIAVGGLPACRPFATTTTVILPDGDGDKTVTVSLKDEAGNESSSATVSITLDTTPPSVSSVSIDSGATYATSKTVAVTVSATDALSGVSEVAFSEDGSTFGAFEPYVPAGNDLTLALPDGDRTVWVKVRDQAGNESTSPASDSIILDTVSPSGSILLAGGDPWSRSTTVSVSVFAGDATSGIASMCLKEDAAPPAGDDTCWIPYASSASFAFSVGDGWRELNAWFEDHAGKVSIIPANEGIGIDTTPPTVPAGVAVVARHRKGTFSWAASSDAASGVARYEVGIAATAGGPYAWTSTGLELSGAITGLQNLRQWYGVVHAIDEVGNASASSTEVAFTPQFPFMETQRLPTSESLHAAAMFSDVDGIALGEAGTAFATSNGWATWSRIDALSDGALNGAAQLGYYGAVVVGDGGHIAWSRDRGTTWTAATSPAGTTNLLAVAGFTGSLSTVVVAVGEGGTLLTAPSLGAPFVARNSGVTTTLRAVAKFGSGIVVAAGDSGVVLLSVNDGDTWTRLTVPAEYASASFHAAVASVYSNAFYLTGSFPSSAPSLLKYDLTSNTFIPISGLTGFSAEAVTASPQYVFLGGSGGVTYRYDGVTFVGCNTPATGTIRALAKGDTSTSFTAVGDHGQITYKTDGLAAWVLRTTGRDSPQFDAWIGNQRAWTGGTGISFSNNDGTSWTLQFYSGPTLLLRGIAAQSSTADPFAVGSGGGIYRFASGGWQSVGSITTKELYGLDCIATECYAAGAEQTLVRYNGSTWSQVETAAGTAALRSVALSLDGATVRGIAVGDGGVVKTLSGTTWSLATAILGAADLLGVATSGSGGVSLAVASDGHVWKTIDRGTTWTQAAALAPGLRAIAWGPSGAWYAAGAGTPIYKSTDDGTTWTALVTGSARVVNGLSAANGPNGSDAVFAVGDSGSILRSLTGGE